MRAFLFALDPTEAQEQAFRSHCGAQRAAEYRRARAHQQEHRFLDRETVARRWYAEEYRPVVRMLAQADLIRERTEAEAYLQLAGQRYRLMRTHRWDDEVIERLRSDGAD